MYPHLSAYFCRRPIDRSSHSSPCLADITCTRADVMCFSSVFDRATMFRGYDACSIRKVEQTSWVSHLYLIPLIEESYRYRSLCSSPILDSFGRSQGDKIYVASPQTDSLSREDADLLIPCLFRSFALFPVTSFLFLTTWLYCMLPPPLLSFWFAFTLLFIIMSESCSPESVPSPINDDCEQVQFPSECPSFLPDIYIQKNHPLHKEGRGTAYVFIQDGSPEGMKEVTTIEHEKMSVPSGREEDTLRQGMSFT